MPQKKRRLPRPPAEDGEELEQFLDEVGAPLPVNLPLSQQITELTSRGQRLDAEADYISRLQPGTNPFSPEYKTLASALLATQNVLHQVEGDLNDAQDSFDQAKNTAKKLIKSGNGGKDVAGDGNTYVQFIDISLGDCTLLTTPKGKRIMIDCGNSGSREDIISNPAMIDLFKNDPFEFVRHQVKGKRFLSGTKTLDMLIFTHPDADHHNRTEQILKSVGLESLKVVYYGGTENFNAKSFKTTKKYVENLLGDDEDDLIRKVTLREENDETHSVTKAINDVIIKATKGKKEAVGKDYKEFIDPVTKAIVLYYEDNFKLSILAGNVVGAWKSNGTGGKKTQDYVTNDSKAKEKDEPVNIGTVPNIKSLMLLVQSFGTNIIICGDSTAVTERVAINQFSSVLSEVTALRMGHHGSQTSSSKAFIKALGKMKIAVASTSGKTSNSHALPRYTILNLYCPLPVSINPPPDKHSIYAWAGKKISQNLEDITVNLWTTGTFGTIYSKIEPPKNNAPNPTLEITLSDE